MYCYFRQCNHCGTRYSYQASGEDCFNAVNNKEYCPQCAKAILDALSKISIKYKSKWIEITENKETIINKLIKLKENYNKLSEIFQKTTKLVYYDGDEYIFNGKHYLHNGDKLYILGEVDNNGNYTKNYWIEDDIGENKYINTFNPLAFKANNKQHE